MEPQEESRTAIVPLTTIIGGVPQLVWEADGSLALTEVPVPQPEAGEVLTADGVTPPEPLLSDDGSDWLHGDS